MSVAVRHMSRGGVLAALAAVITLGGCDLHRESKLKATLSAWFQLGDTLAFESGPRCTAAVFRARSNEIGPDLPMGQSPSDAQGIYGLVGRAAIRMEGVSPHQLTDTMLLANDAGSANMRWARRRRLAPA